MIWSFIPFGFYLFIYLYKNINQVWMKSLTHVKSDVSYLYIFSTEFKWQDFFYSWAL